MTNFLVEFESIINRLLDECSSEIKDSNLKQYATEVQNALNTHFGNNDRFKPIVCKNVYISKNNNNDPWLAVVIPEMPAAGTNVLNVEFPKTYEVDIDLMGLLHGVGGEPFNVREFSAWLMHELFANMLTDTTFCRYKRNFIHYYDVRNLEILRAHNDLGYMSWFSTFANTEKKYINDETNDTITNMMRTVKDANGADYIDNYNCALKKYICSCGGDYNKLTCGYLMDYDKRCLEQFNRLARKYTAYAFHYCNNDYRALVNYLSAHVGSELLKAHIAKEPAHIAVFAERDVYKLFDSSKFLRESADEDVPDDSSAHQITAEDYDAAQVLNMYNELKLDVDNVFCICDKLRVAAKIKDYLKVVECKIAKDRSSQALGKIREDIWCLAKKLENTAVNGSILGGNEFNGEINN